MALLYSASTFWAELKTRVRQLSQARLASVLLAIVEGADAVSEISEQWRAEQISSSSNQWERMAIGSAVCSCLFAVHRAITCCLGADTVKSDTGFDSYVLDHIFEKHQAQIWHGQVNIPFDRTPNWTGAYTLRHVYFYLLFVVNLFLHFAAPRSSYLASLPV